MTAMPLVAIKAEHQQGHAAASNGHASSGTVPGPWTAPGPRTTPPAMPAWPGPLEAEAFHGLAGKFVREVEPYSEADPAALLIHFLVGVGCMIGPLVHASVGYAIHPARLMAVVVGETAHGRKGTAAAPVRYRLLPDADPGFADRIVEGLSSGEGLIYQVRDPVSSWSQAKGKPAQYVVTDPGEDDKRLWVIEPEFAQVLKVAQREGNTLTAVVRRAWDDGDLRTLTKNNPTRATGAHIAIIGHITQEELRRSLTSTDQTSGFANRILWICARRARYLPEGENVPAAVFAPIVSDLQKVLDWARTPRHLARDRAAKEMWARIYPILSGGRSGLLGAVTNRAEAQVLRLSVLYAALDRSPLIRPEHLLAALAVWQYAEASAAQIFGGALGDPVADQILAALKGGLVSRTAIVDQFGRHVRKDRIDTALAVLLEAGLAECVRDTDTGGRPREEWRAL